MSDPLSRRPGAADDQARGITIVTLGVVVLSPDGLLTTLVDADIWTMVFWRGLLMSMVLTAVAVVWPQRQPAAPRFGPATFAIGALFAGSSIAFVHAIVTTSVANTLFLVAVAPLFAAAFGRIFARDPIPLRTVVAIVVTLAGMAVIFGDGLSRGDALGNLSAVAAAACWAGAIVVLRHSPQTDARIAMATGGYLIAAIALVAAPTLIVSQTDALWLGLLGLLVLPLSFGLISRGPRYLPAAEVSLIVLLEAVLGPLWALVFIGQLPSLTTLAGGAVILATLCVYFYLGLRRERAPVGG